MTPELDEKDSFQPIHAPSIEPSSQRRTNDPNALLKKLLAKGMRRPLAELVVSTTKSFPRLTRQKLDPNSTSGSKYYSKYPQGSLPTVEVSADINMSATTRPDVECHFARGQKVMWVRWEMTHPDGEVREALCCPVCRSRGKRQPLAGGKWSITNAGSFKVLLCRHERPAAVISWIWDACEGCNQTWSATQKEILLQLPARVAASYPVNPMLSKKGSGLDFHRDLTGDADLDTVTNMPYSAFMHSVEKGLGKLYADRHNAYLEHVTAHYRVCQLAGDSFSPDDFPPFPSFLEWLGRAEGVPGGEVLFHRMVDAFYEVDPLLGMSENEYLTRLLQMVTVEWDNSVSCDHTHDAAKNFGDKGVTEQYNVCTGDSEIAGFFMTDGTGMPFLLHALESLNRRPGFTPGRNYLDNWPNNIEVWATLWPLCDGRLDIFHVMHRITETLYPGHSESYQAFAALSECIFERSLEDIAAVEAALCDGTLNGHCHTPSEVQDLKDSGKFMQRYRKYIASPTRPGQDIKDRLQAWAIKFLPMADKTTRARLGTATSDQAVALQMTHVHEIVDLGNESILLRPKPNQRHNLVEKRTTRGKVESFHHVAGDFGNTGMTPRAAHMLHMRGVHRWNAERKQFKEYHSFKANDLQVINFSPWLQYRANALAAMSGLPRPYPELPRLQVDTGERFGYDYFLAQKAREADSPDSFTGHPKMCPCEGCALRRTSCVCLACATIRGDVSHDLNLQTRDARLFHALRHAAGLAQDVRQAHLNAILRFLSAGASQQAQKYASSVGIDLRQLYDEYAQVAEKQSRAASAATLTPSQPRALHSLPRGTVTVIPKNHTFIKDIY